MDDIEQIRRDALRLVREIKAGTDQLGRRLNRGFRLPQLIECCARLNGRASDQRETRERRKKALAAMGAIWAVAFGPGPVSA